MDTTGLRTVGHPKWPLWVMQGSCRSFGNVRYSLLKPTFGHYLCSSPPMAKVSVLQWLGYDLPTLKLAAMNSMAAARR